MVEPQQPIYVATCQCTWHQFWARVSWRLACMGPGFTGQRIDAFFARHLGRKRLSR